MANLPSNTNCTGPNCPFCAMILASQNFHEKEDKVIEEPLEDVEDFR